MKIEYKARQATATGCRRSCVFNTQETINNHTNKERDNDMITMRGIKHELETMKKGRSAWARGVYDYAWELIDNVEHNYNYLGTKEHDQISINELERYMLNGAQNWYEYSWGGSSFIYDADIARALCTPSELKKTDNGRRRPNKNEEWLDVQARALVQAANLIKAIAWLLDRKGAQS